MKIVTDPGKWPLTADAIIDHQVGDVRVILAKRFADPRLRCKPVSVRFFVRLFVCLRPLKAGSICGLLVAKGSPLVIKPAAIIVTPEET